jgi:sensor histidine kinase regulating citrate/malate metabolism
MEACQKADVQILRFLAHRDETTARFIFTNTYHTPPDLSRMYEKGYTTKDTTTSGLGLYIVSQLLDANENFSLHTAIEDGKVVQELIVQISGE